MRRRTHLCLMVASEFLGFGAGALAAFFIQRQRGDGSLSHAGWWMGLCVVAGVMLPRMVFRHLIPARCEQEHCLGRAFAEGANPIAYRCRRCGHRVETAVFENTQAGTPDLPDDQ